MGILDYTAKQLLCGFWVGLRKGFAVVEARIETDLSLRSAVRCAIFSYPMSLIHRYKDDNFVGREQIPFGNERQKSKDKSNDKSEGEVPANTTGY